MIKMGLSSLGSSHFHGHNGGVRGHALVAKATFHTFHTFHALERFRNWCRPNPDCGAWWCH